MADDQATFAERFTGAPDQAPPPEVLQPGLGGNTFANPAFAAQYAAQNLRVGNYGRFLAGGISTLAAGTVKAIDSLFSTAQKALTEHLSPEQETEAGLNAALLELGGPRPFLKETAAAIHPIVQEFHDTVTAPSAQRIDSFARTGDPNGVRLESPAPDVKPSPITPVANSPFAGVPRSVLAKTGDPLVDAVLFGPTTRAVIDNPVIDRTRDIPNSWGGATRLNDPTTFISKRFPQTLTVDGITFDPAEPAVLHENAEHRVIEILRAGGMPADAALRAAYWGWGNLVEHAWYRANGINPDHVEAMLRPILDRIATEKGTDVPDGLFRGTYPDGDPQKASAGDVEKPTPEEMAQARQLVRDHYANQPESAGPMLQAARDVGVIGPEKPNINKMPPREAAAAATADVIKAPPPGGPTAWRQRWEKRLDNIQTPSDVRQVLSSIVDANDEFINARRGDMSPGQTEQLGLVSGINPTKIDVSKTSDKIKSDLEMRNITEAFRVVNDKIQEAARDLRDKNGVNDEKEATELTRLELQRDLLLESTVATKGLIAFRAEFARAGHRLQEFYKAQREAAGLKDYLRDQEGRNITDVRDRARMITDTPPEALPRVLQDTARIAKPTHWLFALYQNALISGLITHTLYTPVNIATTIFERSLSPLVASLIDRARGENTSVLGPLYANVALIKAIPDAWAGTVAAFRAGMRPPTEAELELGARDITSPQGVKIAYAKTGINWGLWKSFANISDENLAKAARAIGTPGRAATAQHTFFWILNEQASLASRAFEEAHKEGVTGTQFWERYNYHRANMTDENLKGAVNDGASGTFMEKLGDKTGSLARFLSKTPVLQWFFPFQHIPWNIERMTAKYSPAALANVFLDTKTGQALRGEIGVHEQSLALAKMFNGAAIMAYFIHKGMAGEATPDYPKDQNTQREWKLMGTPQNSVRVNDEWVSMDRMAMPGNLAKMGANLGYIFKHYNGQDDKALQNALWAAAWAAANVVGDEVGFQSVRNFIDVWEGREPPVRFFGQILANFIPALIAQPASGMDPYMRKADSLISEMMFRIPYLRETLPPKRDPLYGEPIPNPHYHALAKEVPVQQDPVKAELDRLRYFPTPPRKEIGGVKLNDEQYDRYEATAGQLVKRKLAAEMGRPGYATLPDAAKIERIRGLISFGREQGRKAMQHFDPQLITQGTNSRYRQINGTQ